MMLQGLVLRSTNRRTNGEARNATTKAIGQLSDHAPIQPEKNPAPNPKALALATPVTIKDIKPERSKLKANGASF